MFLKVLLFHQVFQSEAFKHTGSGFNIYIYIFQSGVIINLFISKNIVKHQCEFNISVDDIKFFFKHMEILIRIIFNRRTRTLQT